MDSLIRCELDYDPIMEQRLAEDAYRKLNEEQKSNFDIIDTAIMEDPHSAHFFLQGYAGTGKTFLYRTLNLPLLQAQVKIVLCVASSGIAALLLPVEITSHSRFRIHLDINESSIRNRISTHRTH